MKKTIYTLLIMLYALMFSCQTDQNDLKKNEGKVPEDVVAKLQKAGFDTSEGLKKYKDGYLVEYDIFLTEDQIDELTAPKSAPKNGRVEHYRTNNLVTGLPRTLRVYMDPSFGSYMQSSFDLALSRYNSQNLRLTFQRVTNAASAELSILAFYEQSNILGYSAGFPSGGNPASPIRLNTYFYNNTSNRPDAPTVIAHEIGHAIGFRHTDYMNRAFSCGSGGNEGDAGVGAVHIPGTPTGGSANSWMLACSNNTDRPFSSSDVTALAGVYGVTSPPNGLVSFHRYYSGSQGDHFYTTNWGELGGGGSGYVYEGVACKIYNYQIAGSVPLYRYYSGSQGDHFYTTNWGELGAGGLGYTFEGYAGYVFTTQLAGTVPIYRYYSGSQGDHFYTANWSELGGGGSGYVYEGVGFYTYP